MICAQRTLTEDVFGAPGEVRAFYTDLNNLTLVHPLVVSVRAGNRSESAHGYVQTYRVRDRIPLGHFTLRTGYLARLHVPVAGHVLAQARQFPCVRLDTVVAFEPIDGGTRIVERIRINAPRVLEAVTVREAVNAHRAMLSGIQRYFE